MNILVIGEEKNFNECCEKFGTDHQYTWPGEHRDVEAFLEQKDVVFDFTIDEDPYCIENYARKSVNVFFNACTISLAELVSLTPEPLKCTVFGFNGLPTFLNTPLMEVSVLRADDKDDLVRLCGELKTKFTLVDDRVGLVTPRIISMIINEAYYTVQEGTASRQDIDNAMKLGTNYPFGPFEWCDRIGVRSVYELLDALYEETKDERYKICALLKKDYLKVR